MTERESELFDLLSNVTAGEYQQMLEACGGNTRRALEMLRIEHTKAGEYIAVPLHVEGDRGEVGSVVVVDDTIRKVEVMQERGNDD